jgi:hypothetical protein
MGRRKLNRAVAVVALLAVAAAVALVLLERDAGGEDSVRVGGMRVGTVEFETAESGGGAAAGSAVRNATPQPDWRPYSGPVPIFRYHEVDQFPAGESYPELFVEPADFRAQMDWLEAQGYQAVDLRTVERAWFDGGTLPRKPVVLSFDGVEGELGTVVRRELSRRGWPGVLVVDGEAPIARQPLVQLLVASGWEVAAAGTDLASSRRRLETELGTRVDNFSFPPEAAEDPDAAAVEAAGYAGAIVTGAGFASRDDPYAMPRITIFGLSGVDGFAEAMRSRGEGVGA